MSELLCVTCGQPIYRRKGGYSHVLTPQHPAWPGLAVEPAPTARDRSPIVRAISWAFGGAR